MVSAVNATVFSCFWQFSPHLNFSWLHILNLRNLTNEHSRSFWRKVELFKPKYCLVQFRRAVCLFCPLYIYLPTYTPIGIIFTANAKNLRNLIIFLNLQIKTAPNETFTVASNYQAQLICKGPSVSQQPRCTYQRTDYNVIQALTTCNSMADCQPVS